MSTDALDLLNTAQRLRSQDEPFALVTVLRVQAPASARPGDKAVVGRDGIVQGWIGGGCAQPAVLRTVQAALADGQARLIRITPQAEGSEPDLNAQIDQLKNQLNDVLEFGMACHSGGTLELFVDPVLPRARLTVIGDSPVAVALAGLAPRVGLAVSVIAHGADAARFPDALRVLAQDDAAAVAQAVAPGTFVVVATQGRRDVQGLRAALALQAAGVWLVASARKAQVLKDALVAAGADAAAVANIVAPAGQAMAAQMGAHTPEEVALSVLAAVVAARRRGPVAPMAQMAPATAQNPAAARQPQLAPPDPSINVSGSCCGGTAAIAPAAPAAQPAIAAAPAPATTPAAASCCGGR